MNSSKTTIRHQPPAPDTKPWKSRRRMIDAAGLAIFHLAIIGSVVASNHSQLSVAPLLAVPILALDALYFASPPKRKSILDHEPGTDKPAPTSEPGNFALEYFLLLVPPAVLIAWFMAIIWQHRALTQHELIAVLVAIPAVVGLVSWLIYLRMTRYHVGVRNNATQFIALSTLATWIGSTFLFVLLAVSFYMKINQH